MQVLWNSKTSKPPLSFLQLVTVPATPLTTSSTVRSSVNGQIIVYVLAYSMPRPPWSPLCAWEALSNFLVIFT